MDLPSVFLRDLSFYSEVIVLKQESVKEGQFNIYRKSKLEIVIQMMSMEIVTSS